MSDRINQLAEECISSYINADCTKCSVLFTTCRQSYPFRPKTIYVLARSACVYYPVHWSVEV